MNKRFFTFPLDKSCKGPAKLENIVAEILLQLQMFPSLAAREHMLRKQILLLGQKKCFCLKSKAFCFPDTNFASATYVSQFSHDRNNVD